MRIPSFLLVIGWQKTVENGRIESDEEKIVSPDALFT